MIPKTLLATALALVSCDSKSEATQGDPTDSAIIQIHRPQSLNGAPPTGNFIATEAAIITSPLTLEKAAKECGLSPEELATSIHSEQIDNTDLVTIKAYRKNEAEAAKILKAVVNAYVLRRNEADKKRREGAIEALDTELQNLGDVANERQKSLTVLIQQYGIPLNLSAALKKERQTEDERFQETQKRFEVLEQERDQLKVHLATLSNSPADIINPLAKSGIHIPKNQIELIYDQYLEAMRQLNALEADGLGASHPKRVVLAKRAEKLLTDGQNSVKWLGQNLKARLSLIEDQIDDMTKTVRGGGSSPVSLSMRTHDYNFAKEEYEEARNILKEAKLQQQKTRSLLKIPHDPITYHKRPGK